MLIDIKVYIFLSGVPPTREKLWQTIVVDKNYKRNFHQTQTRVSIGRSPQIAANSGHEPHPRSVGPAEQE
jgi:hypothetical protein